MKTIKLLLISSVIGASTLMASGSQNQGNFGQMETKQKMHHKGKRSNRINSLIKSLSLSAEQKSKLKEIKKASKQARQASRASHKGTAALKNFIDINGFNKDAYISAVRQRAQSRVEIRADRIQKMISILTPQQRMQLKEKMSTATE